VLDTLHAAENRKKPAASHLWVDVYAKTGDGLPPHLAEQRDALNAHLAKHGDSYGLDDFAPDDT
jgi:hypothetical protein